MADCEQVREIWNALQLAGLSLCVFFTPPRSFLKSVEVFYGKVVELRLFLRKLARAKSRTGYQVPIPKSLFSLLHTEISIFP
jgi:hypothetical protein